MSSRRRIPVFLVVSALIGSTIVITTVPQAVADPCTGAAASIQPSGPVVDDGPPNGSPIGRKPINANNEAPLPALGRLPLAILKSVLPQQGKAQSYAAHIGRTDFAHESPTEPATESAVTATTAIAGWVTGVESAANTLQRFSISGADLGLMWDNGSSAAHQVLMAFGDTYGYCTTRSKQWRFNTLLRTQDRSLTHGLAVADGSMTNQYAGSPQSRPDYSKQIIPSIRWASREQGIIPTAAISVGGLQYLNYMSIKSWDSAGSWTTNYSAVAVSNDNGQNWKTFPESVRPAAPDAISQVPFTPGNENFQQGAFVRGTDGYIYSFGTPSGRNGSAFVSRVPQGGIGDAGQYEYWNTDRGSWIPHDPNAATPIITGPVGEMSAQYNTYLKKYLVMYGDSVGNVMYRTSPAPQGPWAEPQTIVTETQLPGGPYAPFLHPWTTGKELYFNLSLWSAYNVMLMHTTLP